MLLWELSILIDEVKQYAIDLLQKLLNTNFCSKIVFFLREKGASISDKRY